MNWRIATALVLALTMVPLIPAAQASHFQAYGNYPIEHDDLGSSTEPDFRGVTNILGVSVNERAIDVSLDGNGDPSIGLGPLTLAPGCSDDSGRRPSGLCGIETIGAQNGEGTETGLGVPPRLGVGVSGMSGTSAPGLTATKATRVKLLDQKAVADYGVPGLGTQFIEYNRKLADSGLGALLGSIDPDFGGSFLAYSNAHFTWYGTWADLNGNGVIDHLQFGINPQNGLPVESPFNEFQWHGNCKAFDGSTQVGWHCADESATAPGGAVEMAGYIYPGNHHAYCGILIAGQLSNMCANVGTDLPGAAALCLVDAVSQVQIVTQTMGRCFTGDVNAIDENEALFEGDPIFGVQDSVAPDQTFDDRSGDQSWDTRGWYFGLGWATFYYDQSLITSTSMITVVNCNEAADAREYNLATCDFVDVDTYESWSPELETLVAGLKPQARSQFVMVRDGVGPANRGIDGLLNNKVFDQSAVTGPQDDLLRNPGMSREPNTFADSFPGATHGVCVGDGDATHNGWCNSYAGYQGSVARGWADNQAFRSITYDRALHVAPLNGCQLCVSGPGASITDSPENLRAAGDHSRSLGPGGYFFSGASGRWLDRVQQHREQYMDLNPLSPTFGQVLDTTYALAKDGWVGSVVNATGAFYYRGYGNEACATEKGAGTYPFAVCNPYLDGAVTDPQQAGAANHLEWSDNSCDSTSNPGRELQLIPVGGVWTVPVIVIRNHAFLDVPLSITTGQIQDLTGTSGAINIGINCFESGGYLSNDFVILPAGNFGLDVKTQLTQRIPLAAGGFDTVVDVDDYVSWGL